MLFTHSGVKVSIEPAPPIDGLEAYSVVASGDADRVRLAWRDNNVDWRDTGAELCS